MTQKDRRTTRAFVADLQSRGVYHFLIEDLAKAQDVSLVAARASLRRLSEHGEIAMPHRGFVVAVPPEYRALGCLPAEQFIPDLMAYWQEPYYVALLTAAQYHGAAPQQPMRFQVMTPRNRRPLTCGRVAVEFIAKRDLIGPTVNINTRRGTLRISSPELTALDLVGYVRQAGGLDQVATLLGLLAPSLTPAALIEAASPAPVAWVQRLGFLLGMVGAAEVARPLAELVAERKPRVVALAPDAPMAKAQKDRTWRIAINADVEPEL